jgi:AcrR family transcriptional regulator
MQKYRDGLSAADAATARSRGRPRQFDREGALARATRLFWAKGYEATSIAELAGTMGIGSPSLYAAFGSKEALYAEAVRYYVDTYEALVWAGFQAARTAREAALALLLDSAAALTGSVADVPNGCMVTLSSVGSEGYFELGELVRSARALTFDRLKARLEHAVADGEVPAGVDVLALARFVQTVQYGMSILARDGVRRGELEAVAETTMAGWDARIVTFEVCPAAKASPGAPGAR